MNLPSRIKIGGLDIDVVFSDLETNYGFYRHERSEIQISQNLSNAQKYATFIHEVIEAMNMIYDIDLKHHQICLLETALNDSGLIQI